MKFRLVFLCVCSGLFGSCQPDAPVDVVKELTIVYPNPDLVSGEPIPPTIICRIQPTFTGSAQLILEVRIDGDSWTRLANRLVYETAGQVDNAPLPWTGMRHAFGVYEGRTLPVSLGYTQFRLILDPDQSGMSDIVSDPISLFVNSNNYDRDGDGISDAVEDENNGTSIIDHQGATTWFVSGDVSYPPLIPRNITSPNLLYPNRGTHDYSIARGTPTSGTLHNGLRIANQGTGYQYWWGGDLPDSDNWGTLELIDLVERVARKWYSLGHPNHVTSMDMSRQSGGYFGGNPPHTSHQNGLDVDIRYIRSDNSSDGVLITDTQRYSRQRTQELINLFLGTGRVAQILSADTQLQGITYDADHTNHFHVRIYDPDSSN